MTKHLPVEIIAQQIPCNMIKHFLFFSPFTYLLTKGPQGRWFISQWCTASWLPLWKSAGEAETCRRIFFPLFRSWQRKGSGDIIKGDCASSCLECLLFATCSAVKWETSRFPLKGQAAYTQKLGHNQTIRSTLSVLLVLGSWERRWVLGCCCPN